MVHYKKEIYTTLTHDSEEQLERDIKFNSIPDEIIEDAFDHNNGHPDYDLWAFILFEKFILGLSSEKISKLSNTPIDTIKSSFEDYKMIDIVELKNIYNSLEEYKLSLNLSVIEIEVLEGLRKESNFTV